MDVEVTAAFKSMFLTAALRPRPGLLEVKERRNKAAIHTLQ